MLVAVTSGGSGSMRTSSISGEYGVARLQAITLGHDATGWKTAKAGNTHSVGPASRPTWIGFQKFAPSAAGFRTALRWA